MNVYNVSFLWVKDEGGKRSSMIKQMAYTDNEVRSKEEAVGRFLTSDFKNNQGWSIHCWSCNTIELKDKTE
ncbi:hypothetical protein EGT74_24450 [Chitinophaga lutea]|uniref:Uncharacterized protein n=1 Tax=Chitinophaga lutea TaxID=2488634 RepID=A0A3N4PDN4_9BACT|nr:hypothetical protein EGT74_24450 [Chitinophaga lutea]